ncbi:hypothetical protein, partial [Acidovorax cavernicola]|uniref:hypothetical protein n=1 Tax=Acidovorax cavernicola TaxID=1675792 RepID=UPI00142DC335
VIEFTTRGSALLREGGNNIRAFVEMNLQAARKVRTRSCSHENQMMTAVFGSGPYLNMLNMIQPEILNERFNARVANVLLPLLPDQFRGNLENRKSGLYPRSLDFFRSAWGWNRATEGKHVAELAHALVTYYSLPLSQKYIEAALGLASAEAYYEALIYKKDCKETYAPPQFSIFLHTDYVYPDIPDDFRERIGSDLGHALDVMRTALSDEELPILSVC